MGLGLLGPALPADASGRPDVPVVVDPAASVRVAVGHTDLPVGRWSFVRVRVRLAEPAEELRLSGHAEHPQGLRTRTVVLRYVDAGRTVVRLPAKLVTHRPERLVVRALAIGDSTATNTAGTRVRPRG